VDLDLMQERWKSLDGKLDACLRLDRRLVRESVERRLRGFARRELLRNLPGLLLDLVAVLWLGAFVAAHAGEPRFAAAGVPLLAFAILVLAATLRHLVLVGRMDLAQSVVTSQRFLAERKAERSRATVTILVLAPLLWTPLVIVALAALGVDAYRYLGVPWLLANVALGLAAIPAGIALARRLAGRLPGHPVLQRLTDDLAGRNLSAAVAWIGSLDRFERDVNEQ
jgi:hypothetical protein